MKLFMLFCRSLQENELCIDLLTVWKLVQIHNTPLHNLISYSSCNLNTRFHLIIALTATRLVGFFLSFSPMILSHKAIGCLAEETDTMIIVEIPNPQPCLVCPPLFNQVCSSPDFKTLKALDERSEPSSKPTGMSRDAAELSRIKMKPNVEETFWILAGRPSTAVRRSHFHKKGYNKGETEAPSWSAWDSRDFKNRLSC